MLRKYKSRDSELIGTRDKYYLNIWFWTIYSKPIEPIVCSKWPI